MSAPTHASLLSEESFQFTKTEKRYREKWYFPYSRAKKLRKRYNQDREAYYAAYRESHTDRDAGRAVREHTRKTGAACIEAFLSRITQTPQMLSSTGSATGAQPSDILFVVIDFEGRLGNQRARGIREVGFATLDTRDVVAGSLSSRVPDAVSTSNFARGTYTQLQTTNKKFLFGETQSITSSELRQVVVDNLSIRDTADSGAGFRKVVMVAHGLHSEMKVLRYLEICVEEMDHVIGMVDTEQLAIATFGSCRGLRHLLETLSIGYSIKSLHNGGNDAHYTLKALLALLIHRSPEALMPSLQAIVDQPVPSAVSEVRAMQDDWADSLLDGIAFD